MFPKMKTLKTAISILPRFFISFRNQLTLTQITGNSMTTTICIAFLPKVLTKFPHTTSR